MELLKACSLFQVFRKLLTRVHYALPQWATDFLASLANLTRRPVLRVMDLIGKLFCIFAFFLTLLHQILWNLDIMLLKEVLGILLSLCGKRSKAKQEEDKFWEESTLKELSDEDDPEDFSYQPSESETDSEEYKSQNNTETDLEVEDRIGVPMIQEQPKEGLTDEDEGIAGTPNSGAWGREFLEFHTSGNEHEDPCTSYGNVTPKPHTGIFQKRAQSRTW